MPRVGDSDRSSIRLEVEWGAPSGRPICLAIPEASVKALLVAMATLLLLGAAPTRAQLSKGLKGGVSFAKLDYESRFAEDVAGQEKMGFTAGVYVGIGVTQITYAELARAMDRTLSSQPERKKAERLADELIRGAQQTLVDRDYVVRSVQFYHTVTELMQQHESNAFTIECFEFCSSRLPEKFICSTLIFDTD